MENNQNAKTNLIVNYLPQTLTDYEFKNMFQSVGPLKTSKIVRHKTTGYSYGFGFIEYVNEGDAAKAINSLNGYQLQNKRIKVAYSRPGGENIKNANLYLRNIPRNMTESQLESVLREFGDIVQCRILKDATGTKNKGVGFALFDQRQNAEEAIKKLNGQILDGGSDPLVIKYAEDNAKKVRAPMGMTPMTSPYVDPFASPLGGRFGGGGPVRHSLHGRLRYNPMSNNMGSMGSYGFSASPIPAPSDGYILFVFNIGPDTDEKTLWQLFARYGTVQKVNVIREGGTGAGKGYGFVTMPNYEEAVLAIESLNGCNFFGKPMQVSFKSQK